MPFVSFPIPSAKELLVIIVVGVIGLVIAGGTAHGQDRDTTAIDRLREKDVPARPAPPDSVRAEDVAPADTGDTDRAIVNADSLSALVRDGQRLQELFDNVKVTQDTTELRSDFALRYLGRDKLLFTGDVVIYERGDTLRADTVRYNKRTKVGHARSNVRLTDGEVNVHAPRATYYTEEKRSVFPDSVTLIDSTRVLRAQEGTYWSNARRAEFQGRVRLTDPDSYLEADSLTYFRDSERSIAVGNVFIRRVETDENVVGDTSSITYLFGEWADNQEQNRYSRVERQALLVRVRMDSTGAPEDTLAVRAQQLEAHRTDTYRRMVAVDSVRIWQTDMAAVADSAVYDRVIAAGPHDTARAPAPRPTGPSTPPADSVKRYPSRLDSLVATAELARGPLDSLPAPHGPAERASERDEDPAPVADAQYRDVPHDTVRRAERGPPGRGRPPDSTAAADSTRERGPAWGLPVVQSEDALPLEETRLFKAPITWFERSQVWGDSIRVRARKRSIDTVFVRGAAFAAQEDTTVDRIRQLKGKNITAFFQKDSLRTILAQPNGQAIHFSASDDGTLTGATRASADFVKLHLRGGNVTKIEFGRGVQGNAYHEKKYIPDPFRLEGFQWTPERRPTRTALLGAERVRSRLDLPFLKPVPQPEKRPLARVPSDSTVQTPDSTRMEDQTENRYNEGQADGGRSGSGQSPAAQDTVSVPPDSVRARPRPSVRDSSDTSLHNR